MTPKEIANPLANGTRVMWSVSPRETSTGVIESYRWVDMPWKLYQICETGTRKVHFVHPDRILKTWSEPHTVSKPEDN